MATRMREEKVLSYTITNVFLLKAEAGYVLSHKKVYEGLDSSKKTI